MTTTVTVADLGARDHIATGGFGTVYALTAPVPGFAGRLAYKEYRTDIAPEDQAAAMSCARGAIALRDRLSPADRDELDHFAVWPLAMVTDDTGRDVGVLMPLLPDEFFHVRRDPRGTTERRPLNLEWLITSERRRAQAGITVPGWHSPALRFDLLVQLCHAFDLIHRHGYVYGDLSLKNVAFCVAHDRGRIILLDCDGVASENDPDRQQGNTRQWEAPETLAGQALQDRATDCYKLGLTILRCLTPGEFATGGVDLTLLKREYDRAVCDAVALALSSDPADRPTAEQLARVMRSEHARRTQPPRIVHAALSTDFCLRGEAVKIYWSLPGAERVHVWGAPITATSFRYADHPDGCTLKAERSGHLYLNVRNRHGTTPCDLGLLVVIDLPDVHVDGVSLPNVPAPAMPAMPAMPGACLPSLSWAPQLDAEASGAALTDLQRSVTAMGAQVRGLQSVATALGGDHLRKLTAAMNTASMSSLREARRIERKLR